MVTKKYYAIKQLKFGNIVDEKPFLYLCHTTCELFVPKSEKFMSVQTLTNQIVFIYDRLKSQNRQN